MHLLLKLVSDVRGSESWPSRRHREIQAKVRSTTQVQATWSAKVTVRALGIGTVELSEQGRDRAIATGLLGAALVLLLTGLGGVPLRDWDEGTVAQVAREIAQAPSGSQRWLFPTLWGEPYLNKPPLVHWAIAAAYALGGISEWTARLPGALCTALSAPLLYALGRESFVRRLPAALAVLVYLTLLPVVRHGRLAMLDGTVLVVGLLMLLAALRARRDLRWSLGLGVGLGLMALTKGMMALLWLAFALAFLQVDAPRVLRSRYLWLGLLLGSLPAAAWYAAQFWHYGEAFVETTVIRQSLQRITSGTGDLAAPPWYYGPILLRALPWLPLMAYGLGLAWVERQWGWAKLVLVWSGLHWAAILLMASKLPWYILPAYPALALATGAQLQAVLEQPSDRPYPHAWTVILAILAIAAGAGSVYYSWQDPPELWLVVILAGLAIALGASAWLVARRDPQFVAVLVWGCYVSLLLLFASPHWLWELNEAYPVKPVAAIVRQNVPPERTVYTDFAYNRPSLNFYSQHQVVPLADQGLERRWQTRPQAFLLLRSQALERLALEAPNRVASAPPNWVLVHPSNTNLSSGCTLAKKHDPHIEGVPEAGI